MNTLKEFLHHFDWFGRGKRLSKGQNIISYTTFSPIFCSATKLLYQCRVAAPLKEFRHFEILYVPHVWWNLRRLNRMALQQKPQIYWDDKKLNGQSKKVGTRMKIWLGLQTSWFNFASYRIISNYRREKNGHLMLKHYQKNKWFFFLFLWKIGLVVVVASIPTDAVLSLRNLFFSIYGQ